MLWSSTMWRTIFPRDAIAWSQSRADPCKQTISYRERERPSPVYSQPPMRAWQAIRHAVTTLSPVLSRYTVTGGPRNGRYFCSAWDRVTLNAGKCTRQAAVGTATTQKRMKKLDRPSNTDDDPPIVFAFAAEPEVEGPTLVGAPITAVAHLALMQPQQLRCCTPGTFHHGQSFRKGPPAQARIRRS
jgi:hypothetical protein